MHLNPLSNEGGLERNQKQESQGPEEHEEEKQQIHFPLMRKRHHHGSTPMDHFPRLKKMTLNQIQKVGVGALTRFPPMNLRITNSSLVHLPLRGRSLRRH